MDGFKEFQGKDLDSAIKDACAYFDARREQLEIEILQDAKSGIFGIVGARKAKIRARRVRLRETMENVLGSEFGHGDAESAPPAVAQATQARPSQQAGQGRRGAQAPSGAHAEQAAQPVQPAQDQRRQETARGAQASSQTSQAHAEVSSAETGKPSVQPEAKGEAKPARQPSPLQPHRPLRDGRCRQERGVPEPIAMDIGSELAFHAEDYPAEAHQGGERELGGKPGSESQPGRGVTSYASREAGRRQAQGRRRGQDGRGRQSPFVSSDMLDMRDPRLGRDLREGRSPKPVRDGRDGREAREFRDGRERGQRRDRMRSADVPVASLDGPPETQSHGQSALQPDSQRPPRDVPPVPSSTAFEQGAMDDGEDTSAYKPFEEVDQEVAKQCALDVASHLVRPLLDGEPELSADIRDGRILVAVRGVEDCGLLIGREGLTLASVQYFASRIVSKKLEASVRVQLEVGDYRQRQDEKMRELAMLLAQKVLDTGRSFSTRPLSSYHRRIVHMCLRDVDGVQTRSTGDGAMKRVVVMRKRPGAVQPLPERNDEES